MCVFVYFISARAKRWQIINWNFDRCTLRLCLFGRNHTTEITECYTQIQSPIEMYLCIVYDVSTWHTPSDWQICSSDVVHIKSSIWNGQAVSGRAHKDKETKTKGIQRRNGGGREEKRNRERKSGGGAVGARDKKDSFINFIASKNFISIVFLATAADAADAAVLGSQSICELT